MKVYFVGSISGKEKFLENYKAIVTALEKTGHVVKEYTIKPSREDVMALDDDGKVEQYKRVLQWVSEADMVVAEGSYPSIGVGYEISLALEKGKPVVVMHTGGYAPHFLEGFKSEKLLVLKYEMETLANDIKDALDFLSEQVDARFNFFISPQIQHYLDWISRKKMTPRAVHLRNLLERDMEENKEYKQELAGGK